MTHKLGIVIPYRNRPNQLSEFRKSISSYLSTPHEVIVVDQQDDLDFNRGKLLNIGFQKADELGCDYIALHDIDMLPIDADYTYSDKPVHLITELDLPEGVNRQLFDSYFGGVTLFPSYIYKQINGYSNEYYGWGFEDDDLFLRCIENGINLDSKVVPQFTRNAVGLKFNGKDSFAAVPNVLKSFRDYTVFTSFRFDEINRLKENITDNNSIFSIPGFDTTLLINSFFDLSFQFWKKDLSSISINNKILPQGHFNVAVKFSNKSNPACISVYVNGKKIGDNTYDELLPIHKSKLIYLGVGDPNRDEKQNWFNGSIDRFAIFNRCLTDDEIYRLTSEAPHTLFDFTFSDDLVSYYEMLNIKSNTLIDLAGENDGYSSNCKQVYMPKSKDINVFLPHRREGKFKVLPHKENGYKDGYWVNWASRQNQLKYLKKFYKKRSKFKNDGLSTLKYKISQNFSSGNFHHLEVHL